MLRERVAIITGGASGVGRASALKFAEKGARIVIADINKDLGHELAKQITHNNGTAVFLKTDVANADSVRNMIEETLNHFVTIDILYNNAAATTLCNTKDKSPCPKRTVWTLITHGASFGEQTRWPLCIINIRGV